MKLIAVIEDRGGMMFNHRRVSKDRELVLRVEELIKGHRLWIHPCSADLFPDAIVDGNFLGNAGEEDFCFVENVDIKPYLQAIRDLKTGCRKSFYSTGTGGIRQISFSICRWTSFRLFIQRNLKDIPMKKSH